MHSTSRRFNESHEILMDYYSNGVDAKGNDKPGYEGVEDREARLRRLAEAGDSLEEFISCYGATDEEKDNAKTMLDLIDLMLSDARPQKTRNLNMKADHNMASDRFKESLPAVIENCGVDMPKEGSKI